MRNSCHWWVAAPSAGQRKQQTAALSAFRSHQPDCTATGGYITAVSGQQQVLGLHANRDGRTLLQLSAVGLLPACHPLTATHTHTHKHLTHTPATNASQHSSPPCQLCHPCRRGNCHIVSTSRRFVLTTFISTWPTLMFRAKNMHIEYSKSKLVVRGCLVQ